MRKLLKKSLACLLAAIFCVTLCVAAVPASAEAPTYATNDVVAKAGETVNIDFTVNNFANVKGAMIKFFLPEVVASITEVKINGEALAAYNEETGAGYYKVEGNSIKFLSLFGYEGELASASTLTFNVVAVIADDAAEGTYTYAAPYFSVTEDGETLVDVTGKFGKFEIKNGPAQVDIKFSRTMVTVLENLGVTFVVDSTTLPKDIASYEVVVLRDTFDDDCNIVPGTEVVAEHTNPSRYMWQYKGVGMYELTTDFTYKVNCYDADGKIIYYSASTTTSLMNLIKEGYALQGTSATALKNKALYSNLLVLGADAMRYFADLKKGSAMASLVTELTANGGMPDSEATYVESATSVAKEDLNVLAETAVYSDGYSSSDVTLRIMGSYKEAVTPFYMLMNVNTAKFTDSSKFAINVSYYSPYLKKTVGGDAELTVVALPNGALTYRYNFKDVAFFDMNKEVTYTLTYDGEVVLTNTYTVESILNQLYANSSKVSSDLGKSTAAFAKSARDLFNA